MMKPAYLIETTIISAQKINETMPKTPAGVACAAAACEVKMVCSVYSGLVPMSPYTTPSAPNASTARLACAMTSRSFPDAAFTAALGAASSTVCFR